jgi:5-(carboxyamino)imidazole ribonucleotide mutase
MKHITLLVGSETDMHIAESVKKVLDVYEVPYLCEVSSAHKNPDRVREIVLDSASDVFICVASLSAALPGFVASITAKPVIGVPVDAKLGGLDSLLSTVQMPAGVPVAAVGVDNGKNAAYLALRVLGIKYPEALVKSGAAMPASTE